MPLWPKSKRAVPTSNPLLICRANEEGARIALLSALLVGGCVRPNEAPITFGVPDGFVVGREPAQVEGSVRRVEVVYAFHDQPVKATLLWPVSGEARGYRIVTEASLAADAAVNEKILVVIGSGPGVDALVGTLEGVRPTKL